MKLKTNGAKPAEFLKSLLAEGLAGLVTDLSCLSAKEYDGTDLPSAYLGMTASSENLDVLTTGSLADIFKVSPIVGIKELLAEGSSALAEKALFLSYLFDEFDRYSGGKQEAGKNDYELEYVLCGNLSDKANLSGVISKIVLVRLMFCMIHVISDHGKSAEAKEFAMSVLGFTGMPVLVAIMQYLILTIWAFDEALIESSAILKGKKVAIVPTADSFMVGFHEILLVNREYIAAKSDSYPQTPGLSLDYKGYLMLFLLLQQENIQNLRTLDVMQENLRVDDNEFRMSRMLYGFNSSFSFMLPNFFTKLPFTGIQIKKYTYKTVSGARY